MLDSILESLHVIALPTKTDFRAVTSREVALFEGPAGWGEFSPFIEYGAKECVPWLVSAVEAALMTPPNPLRSSIPINATLPAINGHEEIQEVLSWYPGASAVKIKVGKNLLEDLARIEIVRELLPDADIRIDVNGSWSVAVALQGLNQIYASGPIQYVEQPCATLAELRSLKSQLKTPVLITGDEVIRKAANPFELNLFGAVDIVALKVAPLGGIKRALELAEHFALPTVVSSALDSAVGISRGLKLAAVLPQLDFACGLGTSALLSADVALLPILNGEIAVNSVTPDTRALEHYAVSSEKLDWWRARVRDTWAAGAQEWVTREGWVW